MALTSSYSRRRSLQAARLARTDDELLALPGVGLPEISALS